MFWADGFLKMSSKSLRCMAAAAKDLGDRADRARNPGLSSGPRASGAEPVVKRPLRASCKETPKSFCKETPKSFCKETSKSFCKETPKSFCKETCKSFCAL